MDTIRPSAVAAVLSLCVAQAAVAQGGLAADARIERQEIAEGLYVLFGLGQDVIAGNILASVGDDGVLLIDDQFPEIAPLYKQAIREVGGDGGIDLVVNTHWHFDHADGNKALGPEGSWIVAHEQVRRMLQHDNVINLVTQRREQPAFPPAALPVFTYDRSMRLHFNGHEIDLLHFGPAHTTGDTAVIFREAGVVHMGDVFNNAGYPFIDADNGGTLAGIIAFSRAVLDEIGPTAIVLAGHGPVSDYRGLAEYVTMLDTIHGRIEALVASGASLEQVVAARPTAEWDERLGDPGSFLNRAYASMTR